MIMKLTLKHIAPYLPYGVEFILSEEGVFNLGSEYGNPYQAYKPMKIINMIFSDKIEVEVYGEKQNWGAGFIELDEIKPILRPLSDLTKEIEVNGEKFVPTSKVEYQLTIQHVSNYPFDFADLQRIPHRDFENLIKWHFDVFGLIPNGLAIDINTLEP